MGDGAHETNSMCRVIKNRIYTVPRKEQSNAFKLFFHKFVVTVPQIYAMNMDTVERMGRPTSGNAQFDSEVRTQLTSLLLCPADIAEMQQRGAPIQFASDKDAADIYMIITGHLRDWDRAIRDMFIPRDVPIEDLKVLDELAAGLYRYSLRVNSYDATNHRAGARFDVFTQNRGFTLKKSDEMKPKERARTSYQPMIGSILEGMEIVLRRTRV